MSATSETNMRSNGKVIELVDEQARDMARAAIVRSAVTTDDLARVEARLMDRLSRIEMLVIAQVALFVMAVGVVLALR